MVVSLTPDGRNVREMNEECGGGIASVVQQVGVVIVEVRWWWLCSVLHTCAARQMNAGVDGSG